MAVRVKPSECDVLSSAISVAEGLRIMGEENTSYLLLKNEDEILSGIITKTDLLRVLSQLESDAELMGRPLHQFMVKPVKTLSLDLMHTAPEFLFENKIDHVPITYINPETGFEEITGIITIRNLFEKIVKSRGLFPLFSAANEKKIRKTLGVMGVDGSLYSLLDKALSGSPTIDVERFRFADFDFKRIAKQVDALLLDIDDIPERIWLPLVKESMANPELETVFLIYSEKKSGKHVPKLEKLDSLGLFEVFHKPVNISELFDELEEAWLK